ncbi:MAG: hypothetical protein CO094_05720, partial [Anaerolineae bacterium CG_4_9_14_3_um_filter_57_17]
MPTLQQAVNDFFDAKRAQRLSENTLLDYDGILKKFIASIGETQEIDQITAKEIVRYLASLKVSKKRVKNVHITLSSLWTWAVADGICQIHILHTIKSPRPEKRVIAPLEQQDMEALLASTEQSLAYQRPGQSICQNILPTSSSLRDRAILLFLLDTGARATELCKVKVKDIGIQGVYLQGKGAKERIVPLSEPSRKAIDLYLKTRKTNLSDYVFVTSRKTPMTRDALYQLVERIARRAGILQVHPHRFRHTFAINFLRNGGDAFALQMILGHETLEMVKRYLAIAKTDIQRAHVKASPVTNWGL